MIFRSSAIPVRKVRLRCRGNKSMPAFEMSCPSLRKENRKNRNDKQPDDVLGEVCRIKPEMLNPDHYVLAVFTNKLLNSYLRVVAPPVLSPDLPDHLSRCDFIQQRRHGSAKSLALRS